MDDQCKIFDKEEAYDKIFRCKCPMLAMTVHYQGRVSLACTCSPTEWPDLAKFHHFD